MFIVNEKEKEYRFGESGPKYLMKGPRMNFALVRFRPGEDFQAHYHNIMEEDFFILEGKVDIVVDGVKHVLALQNEKILLHHVVVVSPEILPGHKLHQGEIHTGAFHQIFGTAITKAVFAVIFIDNKHGRFSFSINGSASKEAKRFFLSLHRSRRRGLLIAALLQIA